jgi:signal transduction histidine kinase
LSPLILELQMFGWFVYKLMHIPSLEKLKVEWSSKTEKKTDKSGIRFDPAYVKRIIGNLINNAVQAMPNGGKLKINAYREGGAIAITVEELTEILSSLRDIKFSVKNREMENFQNRLPRAYYEYRQI